MGYLQSESQRRSRWKTIGIIVIFLSAVISVGSAQTVVPSGAPSSQTEHNDEFVQHAGTKLVLGGEDFRYSGPNIEWLGIENYGPSENMGPRYPTHFEVDDALDTAKMMGARVIRSQTLGDSVGCELCIEPKPGEFNSEAFRSIDYAVKAAHERGLRFVVTLIGDCTCCDNGGSGQYTEWAGSKWELVCDKCAIDSDMGWPDLSPKGLMGAKYRITAYNADGEPGAPSAAR